MFLEFTDFISDVSEPIGVSHGRGTSYLASEYPILDYFEKSKNKVFTKMKEINQKRTKNDFWVFVLKSCSIRF